MNIQTWGYIRHLYFAERFPKKAIARAFQMSERENTHMAAHRKMTSSYEWASR